MLVLAALPVDPGRVSAAEAAVFRILNVVEVLPFALIWPVMQLGNLLVVPAAALLAADLRRWWLAGAPPGPARTARQPHRPAAALPGGRSCGTVAAVTPCRGDGHADVPPRAPASSAPRSSA